MASEERIFKASVTENEMSSLKSLNGLKNAKKYERAETQDLSIYDETLSQVPCKEEFMESQSDELLENIPELKKTFVIKSKIGEGTFSNVYLAHLVDYPDEMFALKHIIPTSSPDRVEREVRCLQEMGGENNVIGYKGTIRNRDHNVIILQYFPHSRFQDYLHSMTVPNIRDYMKNLLLALKHIHSFSIIHRDIKPGNFLHSQKSGRYNLVDFGLAMHEPHSDKAWEIEKKNGKSSNEKNSRQLSPESSKNGQVQAKKPRTSPRVAVTSHKLARNPSNTIKSTAKESTRHFSKGNKVADVNTKHRGVKFVAPSEQEKKVCRKSSLSSSMMATSLCETKHKIHEICSLCIKRSTQSAPRAGTSGFRAPEVLLKHPQQTTAVDVWSAGVVLLCLLSGKYPFFRCNDDMTALAQIITLFGKKRVMESTKQLGKYMASNTTSPGYELKDLCQKLRFAKRQAGEECKTKCCPSCAKSLVKNEEEYRDTSPASNLRRTSLRGAGKTALKEGDEVLSPTAVVDDNGGIRLSEDKGNSFEKTSKVHIKEEKNSQVQQNTNCSHLGRNEMQGSVETKPGIGLRNGHSRTTSVSVTAKESTHPRSNSDTERISPALRNSRKVRFLSASTRPSSENADELSSDRKRDKSREHLDGSRCTCDCGSCTDYVPVSAYDLLERCLDLDPATRITASEALVHPFLCQSERLGAASQPER